MFYRFLKFIRLSCGLGMLCVLLLQASCSAPKNIAYFQQAAVLHGMAVPEVQPFRLRSQDKINVVVNSANPMLESQFTLTARNGSSQILGSTSTPRTAAGRTSGSAYTVAYTVDEQGTIHFPVLGRISVAGKTRQELATYIEDRLRARELVDDPIVTVEYVNLGVNVLGEVNRPGHVDITQDHFTVIDAIAAAGDLTINGRRQEVMVTRQVNGVNEVYYLDLTNMQQVLTSPAFYLQQSDLVYVSPSDKRKREARAMGNALGTPTVWVSIASLLVALGGIFF